MSVFSSRKKDAEHKTLFADNIFGNSCGLDIKTYNKI